jgi:hypothetical protein
MIHNHTSFILTGAILAATVVTMTLYNMNVVKAQLAHVPNMTKTITSGMSNMSKTMNMTGSKMSKTMNMTAGAGNITKSTHHHKSEITRAPGM